MRLNPPAMRNRTDAYRSALKRWMTRMSTQDVRARGGSYVAFTWGQVWSIHVYVEVGSPFGHPGGAVMLRMGMVMIRAGSRMGNGYSGTFLLKPVIASLYPWWLSGRMYT